MTSEHEDKSTTTLKSPLEAFYSNSTILISGGNGFLGKVLVEKLLRCFNVSKIFLLMRAKNGENVEMRSKKFFHENIFEKISKENSNALDKIIPIEVNYEESTDLIISEKDLNRIINEVEVVFNVIASVRFNEPLNEAIQINYLATKKILKIAHKIEKLKAFVHVSTLYTNCNRMDVDEKIYDHILNYNQLIPFANILKNISDEHDKQIVQDLLFQQLPNTYTLTKHFAEKFIYHESTSIPSGIFRPPIVISSYNDFPGFTDNIYGPAGIIVWAVRGFIHVIHGDASKRANMAPVDYCINALITSAWDIHENFQQRLEKRENIPIYNYIFHENNINWGELMKLVPLGFHTPLERCMWFYSYFIIRSKVAFKILNFIYHTIPACLMDLLMLVVGKKMIYRQAYKKTENILMMMSFFGLREWNFGNENIQRLLEKTRHFPNRLDFDLRNVDWNKYFHAYIPGIKRYYYKENSSNIQRLSAQYQWMRRIHVILKYLIYAVLTKESLKILQTLLTRLITQQGKMKRK